MSKTLRQIITLVVVLIIVLGGGYWLLKRNGSLPGGLVKDSGSNISDYSAVFLTNGQVYFGKISNSSDSYVTLKDIYYLQVVTSPNPIQGTPQQQQQAQQQQSLSLVKLGNELHGPVDEMKISRAQILFFEDMKEDGKVVQAIREYQKNPNGTPTNTQQQAPANTQPQTPTK